MGSLIRAQGSAAPGSCTSSSGDVVAHRQAPPQLLSAMAVEESGASALLPTQRCGASGERFLVFLVTVASLGGFLFGYDTGVVSGAMIKVVPAFDLDSFQHEMVVSSTVALAAVGAACSGPANGALGRRAVLMISCVIFTGGAVLMAVAGTYLVLLWGRMVVGFAVGIASSTVPQYIAELAPPARRGVLVSVNNAAVVVGQVWLTSHPYLT